MSEQQGKPGPRSERLCPPPADYWGWPLFGYTPAACMETGRFGIVGRAGHDGIDAYGVDAYADELQRPTTSAQSGGPK